MIKGKSKWEKHVPFIKANAGKLTRAEMAEKIGTTRSNIYNICYYFNIKLPNETSRRKRPGSKWSKHLPFIREQIGVLPRSEIASQLGITPDALRNLCYRFDLPVPPEDVPSEPSTGRPRVSTARCPDPFSGTKPRGGHRYAGR